MGTQEQYYGGARLLAISADTALTRHPGDTGGEWCFVITASSTGLAVQLPDARVIDSLGYPVLQIVNDGSNAFAVEDAGGTEIIASGDNPQNTVLTFGLLAQDDADGDWRVGEYTLGSGPPPAPTANPWTVGGTNANLDSNAFRYDFVDDSWSEPGGTSSNAFSGGVASFEINEVAYMTNSSGTTDSYNPTSWSTGPTDAGVTSLNGWAATHETDDKGYIMGAFPFSAASDQTISYDVSGDAWDTGLTDIPGIRHKANGHTIASNKIVYAGGATGFGATHSATTTTQEYDITGDSHSSSLTVMTFAREYFACEVDASGDVWAYAGASGGGGSLALIDDVEAYDVSGDSWSTKVDFPDTNFQHGATRIALNGLNYCVGGAGTATNTDAARSHNPGNDSYTDLTDHSVGAEVAGVSQGCVMTLGD